MQGAVLGAKSFMISTCCCLALLFANCPDREGEDVVVNDKLPASASCEVGQAVGGWYNLRGESQVYRTSVNSGGPSEDEASRFKLTCRFVPGLSRLCETKDGRCEQDEVVSGLEYEPRLKRPKRIFSFKYSKPIVISTQSWAG